MGTWVPGGEGDSVLAPPSCSQGGLEKEEAGLDGTRGGGPAHSSFFVGPAAWGRQRMCRECVMGAEGDHD